MPFGNAKYGATIYGFSNDTNGLITCNTTQFMNIGDQIIVANVVSSTGDQFNREYIITNLTANTITVDQDTTSFGTYVSGGYATIEQKINPNPSPQGNYYQQFVPYTVFNQAK